MSHISKQLEQALAHVLNALPTDVLVHAGVPASTALLLLVSKSVRTALTLRCSPLPVAFYPSALAQLARHYPRITSLTLSQETDNAAYAATMSSIAAALPFLGCLRHLDLSALRVESGIERPTFDVRAFYTSLHTHCPSLTHVVLGQLAFDADADMTDDFYYEAYFLFEWLRRTSTISTVSFADMDLHEDDASMLFQECLKNPSLRSLSLSNNAMYSLRLIARRRFFALGAHQFDVPSNLAALDLSRNNLGGGHDDSESQSSAEDFADLVADHPSLRTLNLSHNRVNDAEGAALAVALLRHRHLTALDLSHNSMHAETQHAIRSAWAGPARGLVL